jgi:hypothetical protein
MATFPSSPSFQSVNFKVNTPLLKTTTNSGKVTRVAMGHQFYTFTVKFPQLTPADFGAVNAFMQARLGGYDAFDIVLPKISYTKATQTPSGTVTTTANATAGATGITVSGIGAGRTVLKAGDYFKFSNHTKVYLATADLTGDGSGNGTIYFTGALVQDTSSGATLTLTSVPFRVILDGDVQEYDTGFGGIVSLNLDMREVW